MNIKNFEEVVEATELIKSHGNYVLRKFASSGNYVIIDKIGDFVVLERDAAEAICSFIWGDLAPPEKLN
jgi:hypothetical protein